MTLIDAGRKQGTGAGATLPRHATACITPTYDKSGITIHPSVIDMGRKWNGYRWWLADTPFKDDNDQLENPSVWGSNDRVNWEVPKGLVNPLQLPPAGGYHSDTEIVYDPDTGQMICYWREVSSGGPYLRAMTSTNGSSWHWATVSPNAMSAGSPGITRHEDGTWWRFEYGSGAPHVYTAQAALGPWTYVGKGTGIPTNAWHGDVLRHRGRWLGVYAVLATREVFPAASADGLSWALGAALPGARAYRPDMQPSTFPDFLDMWCGGNGGKTIYRRYHVGLWPEPPA